MINTTCIELEYNVKAYDLKKQLQIQLYIILYYVSLTFRIV